MLFVGLRYSWLTSCGVIHPVFATWLLFFVPVVLSFLTYWSSPKHSIGGNIANATDLVIVTMILLTMVCSGNSQLHFNRFEVVCFIMSAAVIVFWRVTKRSVAANFATQVILTIGYMPMLYHLWHAKSNSESVSTWCLVWISAVVATIPAIIDKDRVGIIYALRAVALVSIALLLMLRI